MAADNVGEKTPAGPAMTVPAAKTSCVRKAVKQKKS
jgi:hypothetical protein